MAEIPLAKNEERDESCRRQVNEVLPGLRVLSGESAQDSSQLWHGGCSHPISPYGLPGSQTCPTLSLGVCALL